MFKAYRYHSNFRNDVPGGFKSLTYSNTIDPSLPLCPVEMAGAICEEPGCIGQHMRDMGLAGMSFLNLHHTSSGLTNWVRTDSRRVT